MKKVSKQEYLLFIKNYPRRLTVDVCGISDPPLVTHNDFSIGTWPDSIVAKTWGYDDDPNGYFYEPEEERDYFIKSGCEEAFQKINLDSGIKLTPGPAYQE